MCFGYLTQNLALLVVEDRVDNVEDGGVAPALVNLHVTRQGDFREFRADLVFSLLLLYL